MCWPGLLGKPIYFEHKCLKMKNIFILLILAFMLLSGCRNCPFQDKPVTPEISLAREKPAVRLPWRVVKGGRVAQISLGRKAQISRQKTVR